ncbi:MAG: methyltransferase [Clostridiales bacterium]|nr:methyltransferase [Clostridiales bacterium]
MAEDERWEPFGTAAGVYTTTESPVGTDALLLAAFSAPGLGERVCDLGTGCGVLPLYWNRERTLPSAQAEVDAVELEAEAARRCARAVERCGLSDRIRTLRADLRSLNGVLPAASYDRVTANPPYFRAVPPGGRGRPASAARRMARFEAGAGEAGCTLAGMAEAAARLLKHGGRFFLCHRPERLTDVLSVLRRQGLEPKRLQLVADTAERAPWLLLCEARKGGRPGLTVEPLYLNETESIRPPAAGGEERA